MTCSIPISACKTDLDKCLVSISKLGYRIACDRPYSMYTPPAQSENMLIQFIEKGEELCITYGPHCNDLLLVECKTIAAL